MKMKLACEVRGEIQESLEERERERDNEDKLDNNKTVRFSLDNEPSLQ